jgi:acetyl esterase
MALNPEVVPLLEIMNSMGLPDPATMTPVEFRQLMPAVPIENPTEVAQVSDRTVPGPEGELPVRVYSSVGSEDCPLLLFYHGGGFVLGDLDTHDELCRRLCVGIGAVVVSVDYRLAPEAKFPAGLQDCYAATCWAVEHAAQLGADGSRLIIAGDSAGGNLAAAVALMARDRGRPAIAHQLLIYPVTHCDFDTGSYVDNGVGYYLTRDMMRWFWDHYLASDAQANDSLASPLLANLTALPTATVVTAEYDPLLDEGIAYAEALAQAGVAVEQRTYPGMIHGFVSMTVGLTQTDAAIEYLCQRAQASLT